MGKLSFCRILCTHLANLLSKLPCGIIHFLFATVKDAFKTSVSDHWLLICGDGFAFNTDLVCILKPHATIY